MSTAETNALAETPGNYADNAHITACVSQSGPAGPIVLHAFALAKTLGAPVTLLQVLEGDQASALPDPLEWDIRRHEARRSLTQLANPPDTSMTRANIQLAAGLIPDEIQRFANDHIGNMLVVGMPATGEPHCRGIGHTLHRLLHQPSGAILLVPPSESGVTLPAYRRIMVPMDGSPWAASALPLAVRLARESHAEMLLAHVIPSPELTETAPYDAADLDLHRRVVERNSRTAHAYLQRMQQNIAELGIKVRIVTDQGRDVRGTLEAIIRRESVDLVILSARGHGLNANADMPYGSVAGYLMMHSPAPLLLVPASIQPNRVPVAAETRDLRMPVLASA